jgi:hypothetical protein
MDGIIRVICEDLENKDIQGICGERLDKLTNHSLLFEAKDLKLKINQAIQSVVSLIDEKSLNDKGYEVSELEFSLNISADGNVSILSIVSGGISVQSGITIKIGRKKNE